MCQYSCRDGFVTDWHLVHLGSRAIGGAGLVIAEASAVADIGRISPGDSGIWCDEHVEGWRRVTTFIQEHGAVPAIQLAHAGWKASTAAPWRGSKAVPVADGGWQPVGVGSDPFADGYPLPASIDEKGIDLVVEQFRVAAERAVAAGFKLIEIHAAHGYLLSSFLSPLSNRRNDGYGGSFENRTRFLLRVVREVRHLTGEDFPLSVRLSCSDWMNGGWSIADSIRLAALLKNAGIDLIDCSSGGVSPGAKISAGPGYQTGFSAAIRREAGICTAAVGNITDAAQAETILGTGQADIVLLAREMLRDPYWPLHAARKLGADPGDFTPKQYLRAW
jgi:2,4-dienoyl-CoA reductase-like NADH-dependent reductase (Old Yellow Enzyme family)